MNTHYSHPQPEMQVYERHPLKAHPIIINKNREGTHQQQIFATGLSYYCYHGSLEQVMRIIATGKANPHQGSNDGKRLRPIHYACFSGNLELVKYLVEELNLELSSTKVKNLVYDLGINKKVGKMSPIDYAILSGNQDLVDYLSDK